MIAFSLRKFFWGLLVVGIGGFIWAHNYGLVGFSFKFSKDWPVFVIVIGLTGIWKALFGRHWWGGEDHNRNDNIPSKAKEMLEDLEGGRINAEDAAERMDE